MFDSRTLTRVPTHSGQGENGQQDRRAPRWDWQDTQQVPPVAGRPDHCDARSGENAGHNELMAMLGTAHSGVGYKVNGVISHGEQQTPHAGMEQLPGVQKPSTDTAAEVGRLLREHGDVLWRFALARVRSADAAEDVVQETALAALKAWGSFAGASSERTWLLGIAAHKAADLLRARQRAHTRADGALAGSPSRNELGFEEMFSDTGGWKVLPRDWGRGGDDAPEQAEAMVALRRCIDALPPSLGEPLHLRDLRGLPAGEVCKSLGLTPTNLWTRLHRARSALRRCVEISLGVPEEDAL